MGVEGEGWGDQGDIWVERGGEEGGGEGGEVGGGGHVEHDVSLSSLLSLHAIFSERAKL